jgi:Ca-activated chloride channel homolog
MIHKLTIVLLLFLPVFSSAQQVKKQIRKGNREYFDGKYNEAELHYRKALEKNPQYGKATYNLGNALYKQNHYEPAISKYESLLETEKDNGTLSKYYYNLGDSYFKTQKLEQSIEAYKQSLRLNPKDQDAKHNLFLAQSMLNQQKNQQNKDQQNRDQQNKDQQNKDQQNKVQQQQQQDQQQNGEKKEAKISKQDAERLLEAMEQDEKDVLKKVEEKKMQGRKIPVEKEW